MSAPGYDGVVLAGGRARRLGGVAKPLLVVGGRSLLDIALAAVADARCRVVVGAGIEVSGVLSTTEDPPGGGPVAALAAALPLTSAPLLVVLAADLPFVEQVHVHRLLAAVDGAAAVAVDDTGSRQLLLAAYRRDALSEALQGDQAGRSMRSLVAELEPVREVRLTGTPAPWYDCDTPDELAAARDLARGLPD